MNREYVVSNSYYKYTKMHRLVMNCPDDMEVDHIYHNKIYFLISLFSIRMFLILSIKSEIVPLFCIT